MDERIKQDLIKIVGEKNYTDGDLELQSVWRK
jgi:hypothetical protein